jgi:hypothetical protein
MPAQRASQPLASKSFQSPEVASALLNSARLLGSVKAVLRFAGRGQGIAAAAEVI